MSKVLSISFLPPGILVVVSHLAGIKTRVGPKHGGINIRQPLDVQQLLYTRQRTPFQS